MAIRRSEDCYVDELFGAAVGLGLPMLTTHFPRAYLDVNREPWGGARPQDVCRAPILPFVNIRSVRVASGLGTAPKAVGEGLEIYPGWLPFSEAVERIESVDKPYHETLRRLVIYTQKCFGYAMLVDCHSMPAFIRIDETGIWPDFIVGDCFGTSANSALSQGTISLLTPMGYSVAHNRPYAVGFITEYYGRPACNIHALQIELNRGLYMDEQTLQKSIGFDALANDLARFSTDLMAIPYTTSSTYHW